MLEQLLFSIKFVSLRVLIQHNILHLKLNYGKECNEKFSSRRVIYDNLTAVLQENVHILVLLLNKLIPKSNIRNANGGHAACGCRDSLSPLVYKSFTYNAVKLYWSTRIRTAPTCKCAVNRVRYMVGKRI